jgi:hypothetical protein
MQIPFRNKEPNFLHFYLIYIHCRVDNALINLFFVYLRAIFMSHHLTTIYYLKSFTKTSFSIKRNNFSL